MTAWPRRLSWSVDPLDFLPGGEKVLNSELISLPRRLIQRLLMMDADASRCIASIILCLEIGLKCRLMVVDFLFVLFLFSFLPC